MRFAEPGWLWALLLLPVLFGLLIWNLRRRKKLLASFAQPKLWPALVPELDWFKPKFKGALWILALGFAILALARPQWGMREEISKVSGLDVMIVLDVSNSMLVEDVVPDRLRKAKHAVRSLVNRLRGDRVGVIGFAGSVFLATPLTTDLRYALEALDVLGPASVTGQGTDIGLALDSAARAIDGGSEEAAEGASAESQKNSSRVVILISDGEDHAERLEEGANRIAKAGARLYVLGIGTKEGGKIPVRDPQGMLHGYKRDEQGQEVVSRFDSSSLSQLAEAASGRYWTISPNESEIEELSNDLGTLERGEYAERKVVVYHERYQIPLAIAIALLLIELSIPARAMSRKRERAAAAAVIIGVGSLLDLMGVRLIADARATGIDAYFENEKGIKAYEEGRIQEAQRHFGEAQAHDPNLPELQFNQGNVQVQNGDVEGSIMSFSAAAQGAIEKGKPELAANSLYNLGSAKARKGDTKGAVESYLRSMEIARSTGNDKLAEDTRKSIELLYQEKQKQKQQQQQQQQDSQGNPGDPNQQGEGQPKNQPDETDKKDQKGNDPSDPSKEERPREVETSSKRQQFKSEKLSKEDADRVMAELSAKERELAKKVRKQKGARLDERQDW